MGYQTDVNHPASWKSWGMMAMAGPVRPDTRRETPPTNLILPGMTASAVAVDGGDGEKVTDGE
jgi:hypothetical protein